MKFDLGNISTTKVAAFLKNKNNIGHVDRHDDFVDFERYLDEGMDSSLNAARLIEKELPLINPTIILEIGCSIGLNCFALQSVYPCAKIIGVEPEGAAVQLANELSQSRTQSEASPIFLKAIGEQLPLEDNSVDLIICHTVIEHVTDVAMVISEAARVLRVGGYLHLEAPNYLWPHEPHLDIWCIPLLGKKSVSYFAKLQGRGAAREFLDHLQFVTPFQLEAEFKKNNLAWENRVRAKIINIFNNDLSAVKKYKLLASILKFTKLLGLSSVIEEAVILSGLYPSILYTIQKEMDVETRDKHK